MLELSMFGEEVTADRSVAGGCAGTSSEARPEAEDGEGGSAEALAELE